MILHYRTIVLSANLPREITRRVMNTKLTICKLLAIYAAYRRNKLLHGDHVDPTFLFPDVNADILSEIAVIIFSN